MDLYATVASRGEVGKVTAIAAQTSGGGRPSGETARSRKKASASVNPRAGSPTDQLLW